MFLFLYQHVAMNKKHALEAFRSPKSTLIQLLVPIIVTLIFWGVVKNKLAPPDDSSAVLDLTLPPACGDTCNPIVFWPLTDSTWAIMNTFAQNKKLKIADRSTGVSLANSGKYDIIGIPNSSFVNRT